MPVDLSASSTPTLFHELRRVLVELGGTKDTAANHRLTDEASNIVTEILHRPDGAWQSFLPLLNDPEPMMRMQAAHCVLDDRPDLAIPVLKELNEGSGLASEGSYLTLFELRRQGKIS